MFNPDWLTRKEAKKNDYLIVVCDTFDWEDFPVYVKKENFWQKFAEHDGKNMEKIMEVYDLHGDLKAQVLEWRAWHTPTGRP